MDRELTNVPDRLLQALAHAPVIPENEITAYARRHTVTWRRQKPERTEPTNAELVVLRYISHGLTVPETADLLGKSYSTVHQQVLTARRRMAAKNTPHAIAICMRNGWLD